MNAVRGLEPCSMAELWPPFGLVIIGGDLQLTPVSDDDLCGLVDLVRSGVHPPDAMPFGVPWTQAPPEELARRFAQHHWETRARFSRGRFSLDLAVRSRGELVGVQGFHAESFAVTRTAETGSWLAQRFQGRGIGTAMRQAVCAFLFDHLRATEVTSGAFEDNAASLGVSRKVGYRPNGVQRHDRLGSLALNRRLVLDPRDFVRGETITVAGAEPLRRFLGVA